MILKSLKLKDFRQFKGEQTITFADSPQKNVTIIMGDNGAGKTTLAQAFTWCLYGDVDGFVMDKILLCKATSKDMLPGQTEKVRVELVLIHRRREYTIISEQQYRRTDKADKPVESAGQRYFGIKYKQEDGQTEDVKVTKLEGTMREILPRELARYFFFDGERITLMSKELSQGKGREFANAVRSLLGLDAFTSAIEHLKGAVKEYNKDYDARSDSKISEYTREIDNLEQKITDIEKRIEEIDNQEAPTVEKIDELKNAIEKNKLSADLAARKNKLISRRELLIKKKERDIEDLLKVFKRAPAYFARKMMHDSLQELKEERKLEKSVPAVTAKTIDHLIERRSCICGAEISIGNDAFNTLNELRSYVPPKSISDSIDDFRAKCKEKARDSDGMFTDFIGRYTEVCTFDSANDETTQEISNIEKELEVLKDVGKLQSDLMRYEKHLRDLRSDKEGLISRRGGLMETRNRTESRRDELALKDKNNRSIMIFREYAQYMLNTLREQYSIEETKIRNKLEESVNEIFRSILGEGFSLNLSEKYDVAVTLSDFGGFSETSTAQNISIIFAFISGVIKLARDSQKDEGGLLVTEPYPFVMDAPLSAFDKTRIKNVCDVLPVIAEQVIIFIKDTDGEIAEEHLGEKIGKRLTFDAKSKIETYVS